MLRQLGAALEFAVLTFSARIGSIAGIAVPHGARLDQQVVKGNKMTQPEHIEIKYFVNGEEETSIKSQLTVKEILEYAGFTPATDYTLASENPPKDFDSQYEQVVKIHPNERFQAQFKGPTPTS